VNLLGVARADRDPDCRTQGTGFRMYVGTATCARNEMLLSHTLIRGVFQPMTFPDSNSRSPESACGRRPLRAVKIKLTLNDNNLSGVVRLMALFVQSSFPLRRGILSLSHRRALRLLFHLAR
jgi:hypothetical protein